MGVIKDHFTVKAFKGDNDRLIRAIVRNGRMTVDEAERMLIHNVLDTIQFMQLTGVSRSTFNNLCKPRFSFVHDLSESDRQPPVLTRVFPFFRKGEAGQKEGIIFILRDESCEKKLYEYNNISR